MKSSERALSPDKSYGRKGLKLAEGRHKRLIDGSSISTYDPRRLRSSGQRNLGQKSCGLVGRIMVAQISLHGNKYKSPFLCSFAFSEGRSQAITRSS